MFTPSGAPPPQPPIQANQAFNKKAQIEKGKAKLAALAARKTKGIATLSTVVQKPFSDIVEALEKDASRDPQDAVNKIKDIYRTFKAVQDILDDSEKPALERQRSLTVHKDALEQYRADILVRLQGLEQAYADLSKVGTLLSMRKKALSLNKKIVLDQTLVPEEVLKRFKPQNQEDERLVLSQKQQALEKLDNFYKEATKELANIYKALESIATVDFECELEEPNIELAEKVVEKKEAINKLSAEKTIEEKKTDMRDKVENSKEICAAFETEYAKNKATVDMYGAMIPKLKNGIPQDIIGNTKKLLNDFDKYFSLDRFDNLEDLNKKQRETLLECMKLQEQRSIWFKRLEVLKEKKEAVVKPEVKKRGLTLMKSEEFEKIKNENTKLWSKLPIAVHVVDQLDDDDDILQDHFEIVINHDGAIETIVVEDVVVADELRTFFEAGSRENFKNAVVERLNKGEDSATKDLDKYAVVRDWILEKGHNFESKNGKKQDALLPNELLEREAVFNNSDYYSVQGLSKYRWDDILKIGEALNLEYDSSLLEKIEFELSKSLKTLDKDPKKWMEKSQKIKGQHPLDFLNDVLGFDVIVAFQDPERKAERLMPEQLSEHEQMVLNNEDYYNLTGPTLYTWEDIAKLAIALGFDIEHDEAVLQVQTALEAALKTEEADPEKWAEQQKIKDTQPRAFLEKTLGFDIVKTFEKRGKKVLDPADKPKPKPIPDQANGLGGADPALVLQYETNLNAEKALAAVQKMRAEQAEAEKEALRIRAEAAEAEKAELQKKVGSEGRRLTQAEKLSRR